VQRVGHPARPQDGDLDALGLPRRRRGRERNAMGSSGRITKVRIVGVSTITSSSFAVAGA